jgi:hypothetical protein
MSPKHGGLQQLLNGGKLQKMGAFGRMGAHHPRFLKLAPTLGSVKSSIPHGDWRFNFFSNFFSSKFRVQLDLHIYHWGH